MGGQNVLGFIFFFIQNGKSKVHGYRHAEQPMEICFPDLHTAGFPVLFIFPAI